MNSSDSNPGPLFDYRVALCGPDEARLSDIVPADPVEDSKLISLYLKELFSSLARKESDPAKGLTRASFDTVSSPPLYPYVVHGPARNARRPSICGVLRAQGAASKHGELRGGDGASAHPRV